MPQYAMVELSNSALTRESVRSLAAEQSALIEQLREPGTLVRVAVEHLGLTDAHRSYLEALPATCQEAIRAAIVDAIDRGLAVQLSFKPDYDFSVSIWEYGDALGIGVKGPYTSAPYPREGFVSD